MRIGGVALYLLIGIGAGIGDYRDWRDRCNQSEIAGAIMAGILWPIAAGERLINPEFRHPCEPPASQ